MNIALLTVALTTVLGSGIIISNAYAQISPNNSFIIEGSGFLATEQSIKTSEIDFIINTGDQTGSRTNIEIENGFLTINNDDYLIIESSATSLREGKYLRISATAESPDMGNNITISILGRLIQNSQDGSIYTFTGRILDGNTEYKIIYISQLSSLSISPTITTQQSDQEDAITIRILDGASNPALTSSYIDKTSTQLAGYFSMDRVTIEPGTSVTFVNNDTVSHTIQSGTGLAATSRVNSGGFVLCDEQPEAREGSSYVQNNCDFTLDGRLNSGIIDPGESWTATFDEMGFYRLIDPDYPWMNIVVYSFPDSDNLLIRQGDNRLGN